MIGQLIDLCLWTGAFALILALLAWAESRWNKKQQKPQRRRIAEWREWGPR